MRNKLENKNISEKSSNVLIASIAKCVFGRILFILSFVLVLSLEANAQFVVQPMQIILEGRSGSLIRQKFKLQNMSKYETQYVSMDIVDLVQANDGTWSVLDANTIGNPEMNYNAELHSSCKDWVRIRKTDAEVPSMDSITQELEVRIPKGKRGFACAALRVRLKPRLDTGGVVLRYDFIVPILVSINGPSLRTKVEITDVALKYNEAKDNQSDNTTLFVKVQNNGGTYSQLASNATIWQVLSDRNRIIERDIALPSLGIIPGAEINIPVKLNASLPTGTYKISANLSVDGRRVRGLTKELDFVNPVLQGMAKMGTAMRVTPNIVEFELIPGRRDSQKITIQNYSEDDIVIKAIPVVPPALANKYALVRGDSLSCSDWIQVSPDEIAVRAGRDRNVNVIVSMPKEDELPVLDVDLTNYYADIKFYGFYRDKSSAGSTSALVNVMRDGADPVPVIKENSMKINGLGDNKCQIIGVFSNIGTIHVDPVCTGRLLTNEGVGISTMLKNMKLENASAKGVMMPFERREFSTVVDLSDVPLGQYVVSLRLDYGVEDVFSEIRRMYEVFENSITGEKEVIAVDDISPNG